MRSFFIPGLLLTLIVGVWLGLRPAPTPSPSPQPAPVVPPIADPLVRPIVLTPPVERDSETGGYARPEPHGEQLCASGCALSRHPTPTLGLKKFHALLESYAQEPMSEASPALEELLYHGRQVLTLLASHGGSPLDTERLAFLEQELRRDTVRIELRVVDQEGRVRSSFEPTSVPLDIRHVFDMETDDLPRPLITSGTVKRVGLHHFWQRL